MTPHASQMIRRIRKIARWYGWAIGVHGTLKRDIDLIAVPWTKTAASWIDLWLALEKKVPLWRGGIDLKKPHGRCACIMLKPGSKVRRDRKNFSPAQIDLSFVPINQMRPMKARKRP